MLCSFRSHLILLASLAMISGGPVVGKARAAAPPKPHFPKPPAMPRFPHVPPAFRGMGHFPPTKVIHYPRPIVHRGQLPHMRLGTNRFVRQPFRGTAIRRVHRYPIHRLPRRFVRRPNHYYGHRRYSYMYYPGRYRWRTNRYNRGYGFRPRVVGGIVQSVQGGALMVRVPRSRFGRFRYAGAGRGATTVRRFLLNPATLYEVMTFPPRGGTVADLRRGERVLILTHTHTANTAQKVSVVSRARRR